MFDVLFDFLHMESVELLSEMSQNDNKVCINHQLFNLI